MATLELYRDEDGLTDPPILEGQMTNSGNMPEISGIGSGSGLDAPFNTLDEPIRETIWRDVKAVGNKFKHVLYPVQKTSLLKVRVLLMFVFRSFVFLHWRGHFSKKVRPQILMVIDPFSNQNTCRLLLIEVNRV
jgi:hypothetical protein